MTILCDGAARYVDTFNVEFGSERGLPHPRLVDGEDDVDAAARSVMVEYEQALLDSRLLRCTLPWPPAPCRVCMQRSVHRSVII